MLEAVWGRVIEYYQAERATAPVKFAQRGDGDGSKNETPGDPPDGEPPEEARLRPDTGRPGDLKEIRLKGWAPIPIRRRLRASQLGEALFCREN